jgi:hypothetical protein
MVRTFKAEFLATEFSSEFFAQQAAQNGIKNPFSETEVKKAAGLSAIATAASTATVALSRGIPMFWTITPSYLATSFSEEVWASIAASIKTSKD